MRIVRRFNERIGLLATVEPEGHLSGKPTIRPCASFSLADRTDTIAAFTSRHSASHGRLGKKRTTGLDGFDEFLTLRRGRRTAHNAGVMMVSRSYAHDCTSERHRRSSGDAIRRVLRLFGSRLRSGGSRLPYSSACRGLRRRGAGSSYMAETRMGDCQAKKSPKRQGGSISNPATDLFDVLLLRHRSIGGQ